jgi:hypothetical protein
MNSSLILQNILNPPVLFFFAGLIATMVKSDLEIPKPLPKLFSLYLLLSIGFKGGYEIAESGFTKEVVITLLISILMASIVPVYSFFILRFKFDIYNAAAIAATYGSISAVTFVTATSFLSKLNIPFSGHMVAALALMESPAIVIGLVLVRFFAKARGSKKQNLDDSNSFDTESEEEFSWNEVLREAFLNGSVYLLIASLVIGFITGDAGWQKLKPFVHENFYGVLAFFLLDMGLVAAKRMGDLKKTGIFALAFSILMPLANALIGIAIGKSIGMNQGNALLFSILCASASYIAVPAAMRMSVPEANPSIYIAMALAITFPFNIIFGIPLYFGLVQLFGIAA